ncbi:methyltransferase [Archangium sp. Cb G35]|uniref:methyltransferase n=1 Tax=Archangium sp. Cb G35 TaxID=1920190 RepID=UPI0009FB8290|nr:methyltransferase [Archangium sp. Cb G35]
MSPWAGTRVSADRTHHTREGAPLYPVRFIEVLSFHAPGLAAAKDGTGAFHIDVLGRAVYARRFTRTFGFYEELATVVDGSGAFHIRPDGSELSPERYAWCGNFQDDRCTVRTKDGRYFHVDRKGNPAYAERYAYAGDFRDGLAVVQDASGLHLHIHKDGLPLNGRRFLDLDVFHKGYARARDERGWHHVNTQGEPLYARRFAMVEPFYNGQARVESEDGSLLVIDEEGASVHEPRQPRRSELQSLSGDMVGFWRTQALRAAAELRIIEALPASTSQVAELRALAPDRCERLLRAMDELGLVTRQGDTWRATSRGALLHREHPLQMVDAALHWGRDCYRLWETLPEALRAEGTWEPPRFFDELSEDPRRVASYHRAMASYARQDYASLAEHLRALTQGIVVDAGGGTGTLLFELLTRRPGLRGVLLERPEVTRQAEIPPELAGRVTLLPADIFTPWEVRAHAVILSRILHDWDEARAALILEQARQALLPGGRIHVIEFLLDEEEPGGGLLDLHMLVSTGGRERTGTQFRVLFERVGLRYLESQRLAGGNWLFTLEPH